MIIYDRTDQGLSVEHPHCNFSVDEEFKFPASALQVGSLLGEHDRVDDSGSVKRTC